MIAFDTNFLVRYLTEDDPVQTGIVNEVLENTREEDPVFISLIVLVETTWVLGRAYGVTKPDLVTVLDSLLDDPYFALEREDLIVAALEVFRDGRADFPDYLLGRVAISWGADEVFTFDKMLKESPHFRVF